MKRPVTLIIMDGFGIDAPDPKINAIAAAKTPNLDKLMAESPMCKLQASGEDVGLPAGQMGNSEVGHTNIGAGRVVFQDLPRITVAIRDGSSHTLPLACRTSSGTVPHRMNCPSFITRTSSAMASTSDTMWVERTTIRSPA